MANHPKIERGIEMPERGNHKYQWLNKLEVGDSFVVSSGKVAGIRTAAMKMNIKIASRSIKSHEHRIWRVS